MLDTGAWVIDLLTVDNTTITTDNNKFAYKYCWDGTHSTKASKLQRRKSTKIIGSHSGYIELSDWAYQTVITYYNLTKHNYTQHTGIIMGLHKTKHQPLTEESIQKLIKKHIDTTPLANRSPPVTPHKLKHICISKWRQWGWSLDEISSRAHTTEKTLQIYYLSDYCSAEKLNRQESSS